MIHSPVGTQPLKRVNY